MCRLRWVEASEVAKVSGKWMGMDAVAVTIMCERRIGPPNQFLNKPLKQIPSPPPPPPQGLLLPSLPRGTATIAAALVGSVLMPHNVFLHSALVLTRTRDATVTTPHKRRALWYLGTDSAIALLLSLAINVAVVAVFAKGFYGQPGAGQAGLTTAGAMLVAAYGPAMR